MLIPANTLKHISKLSLSLLLFASAQTLFSEELSQEIFSKENREYYSQETDSNNTPQFSVSLSPDAKGQNGILTVFEKSEEIALVTFKRNTPSNPVTGLMQAERGIGFEWENTSENWFISSVSFSNDIFTLQLTSSLTRSSGGPQPEQVITINIGYWDWLTNLFGNATAGTEAPRITETTQNDYNNNAQTEVTNALEQELIEPLVRITVATETPVETEDSTDSRKEDPYKTHMYEQSH